jgi:hypothetical protein
MSTKVAAADWIKNIVDDERRRDAVLLEEYELAARKADLVRRSGRRVIDELRATVIRDLDAFVGEFAGDPGRSIVIETEADSGALVIRKPAPSAVALTVTPNLGDAALVCVYRFTHASTLPPREDRLQIMFTDDGSDVLQMKHHGTGHVFLTSDALSEFLLTPVLTGRPR